MKYGIYILSNGPRNESSEESYLKQFVKGPVLPCSWQPKQSLTWNLRQDIQLAETDGGNLASKVTSTVNFDTLNS